MGSGASTPRVCLEGFLFFMHLTVFTGYLGFLAGSDGEEISCNAGDPVLIPGLGRSSGEGKGNSLQYSCLCLAGYGPWGHKSQTHLSK